MTMSFPIRTNVPTGLGLAVATGLLLTAQPAAAQVQSEKLQVQARIGDLCTVTSASLDFGPGIDIGSNNDAEGSIEIDCAGTASVGVQLDGGTHNQFGSRRLANGSGDQFLLYDLYKDSARGQPWAAGDQVTQTISSTGSIPVYGRIPSQSDGHGPGLYTDEVTITLVF